MVSQLRMYTIQEGKMEAWLKGWREGVVPLRRRHGFRVDGAWIIRGENRFVWILTYDGPESWETKDSAYYASPERAALAPDPAQFIGKAETWLMDAVPRPPGADDRGLGHV